MKKSNFFKIILFVGDVGLMYFALFLAVLFRQKDLLGQFNEFFYNFLILYILWIFVIFVLSLYDLRFFKKPIDFIFNLIIFSVLAFFIGVTYFYFRPSFGITPKTILLLNVLIFDVLFLIWRYLFNIFLEFKGVKEKVVIIGSHKKLDEILPQVKKTYEVVAVLSASEALKSKNVVAGNYIRIDDLYESITKKVSLDHLEEVWFLEKFSKPENIFFKIIKRVFDLFFGVIGLILFIVSFPFAAIAIKMETGESIFYKQKRFGKNGKVIMIYKFGTMFGNDDKENDKKLWRSSDKKQITKTGNFLRKTHIDELPQALNLLKGDLSFVGPRAEWVEQANIFEKEIPFYKQRYLVKPGLFGWAQINFKASQSVDEAKEKFEYDLYYIKNRSLLLDLEIILKSMRLFIF